MTDERRLVSPKQRNDYGRFIEWFLGEYDIDPIGDDWKRLTEALAALPQPATEPPLPLLRERRRGRRRRVDRPAARGRTD